jgi:fructoselysine 6-kinase
MCRVIGVGDNTVDIYIHRKTMYPGGNAVNVAVLAKRLGCEAAYIGWLGNDLRGELIQSALKAEGLDISRCRVVNTLPTGYSTVTLVDGDRVFGEADNGANQLLHLEKKDFEFISTFDVVHTSVFSYLETQLPELRAASKLLSFDLSQRHDDAYLDMVLPYVNVVFLSLSDIPEKYQEELMHRMHSMGPKLVVATRGKDGAWVFDGDTFHHQGIVPVEVVDTLGAGDAFAACFLASYAGGTPIPSALQKAAQFAARNCTHFGAFGYEKPL